MSDFYNPTNGVKGVGILPPLLGWNIKTLHSIMYFSRITHTFFTVDMFHRPFPVMYYQDSSPPWTRPTTSYVTYPSPSPFFSLINLWSFGQSRQYSTSASQTTRTSTITFRNLLFRPSHPTLVHHPRVSSNGSSHPKTSVTPWWLPRHKSHSTSFGPTQITRRSVGTGSSVLST